MVDQPLDTASAVMLPSQPTRAFSDQFSVRSVDLGPVRGTGLPVFVLDEFRVGNHAFGPHPHAGFSAVTYVLEDSTGGLRSRDSLGNDIVVGPGGIVWTQAGLGVLHEEHVAHPGRLLHGLQVFVNLPAAQKLTPPQVWHLDGPDVPEWRGAAGDRVRVVVGRYAGLASPLQPTTPLRWLDVDLCSSLELDLPEGHCMLAYVLQGHARLQHRPQQLDVATGQCVVLRGTAAPLQLHAGAGGGRIVMLSGAAINEPMVGNGPFMMNDTQQLQDAVRRYQAGLMGALSPIGA